MAIFAVISLASGQEQALQAAVQRTYPQSKHFKVAEGHWLVSDAATAQDVTFRLGVNAGQAGMVIIYNVGGYFGYASTPIWEWIQANWGGGRSG